MVLIILADSKFEMFVMLQKYILEARVLCFRHVLIDAF